MLNATYNLLYVNRTRQTINNKKDIVVELDYRRRYSDTPSKQMYRLHYLLYSSHSAVDNHNLDF